MAFIPIKGLVMQLAKRALRRVHFDSQLFSTGYSGVDAKDCRRINIGPGAEIALETTLAAAIAQEFNASKMTHGWLTPRDRKKRFYVVDREVAYKLTRRGDTEYIDLVIRRPEERTKSGRVRRFGIQPIELKRARRYLPDLPTGDPGRGKVQVAAVKKDVAKLKAFAEAWKAGTIHCDYGRRFPHTSRVYPQVLVWGIADTRTKGKRDESPERFIHAAVGNDLRGEVECAWVPVAWDLGNGRAPPAVTSWVWIALAEIKI